MAEPKNNSQPISGTRESPADSALDSVTSASSKTLKQVADEIAEETLRAFNSNHKPSHKEQMDAIMKNGMDNLRKAAQEAKNQQVTFSASNNPNSTDSSSPEKSPSASTKPSHDQQVEAMMKKGMENLRKAAQEAKNQQKK